jgi:outer membrane protein assembly factor BamB
MMHLRLWILLFSVIIALSLSGCSEEEQKTTPTPPPTTPIPTQSPTTPVKTLKLVEISSSKERLYEHIIPEHLLPPKHTWTLIKRDERSDMYYPSFVPREPDVGFKINVSPNFGGMLATPVIFDNLILLSDMKYLYAYNRDNGLLLWKWRYEKPENADIKAYGVGSNIYTAIFKTYSGGRYDMIMLALDSAGNRVWKSKITSSKANFPTSNLLVAEGRIFIGTVNGMLYSFSEGGNLAWERELGGIVRGLAYGDGLVFANSEGVSKIFAIDATSGDIVWEKEFSGEVSTPLYSEGRILFIAGSKLTCVSSDGKLLWQKAVGAGSDSNTNSFISAKKNRIYYARTIGDKPLSLYALNLDGKKVSEFKLEDGEYPFIPITTEDVVILPVTKYNEYSKIYLLWRGQNKIYELRFKSEETFAPKIAVDGGEIFVIFSINRTDGVLYKLHDKRKPVIKDVKVELKNESIIITSTIYDSESSIFKALIFYSINNSEWKIDEMVLGRRYIMEPIGGYGFREEEYTHTIKFEMDLNSTIEFFIVGIDKVGNYITSEIYSYKVVED